MPGQRNVIESSSDLSAFAFLNGYRNQSPVVSSLRLQSKVGLEWRTDYDPVRHGFVNSGLTMDGRYKKVAVALGHNSVKADPILAPSANQFRGQITLGNENRRGFNTGFSAYYDYRKGVLQYSQTQVTYNTDCCGFSVQYRRFNFNVIADNQFRVAFAIANIGSFGGSAASENAFYINGFPVTNPLTNSYKRLIPGFEAPVLLAYSARNRSASCRIPFGNTPKAKRVEVRFPDPMANPYLAFSALLMAGLDGIQNKIDPGAAMDKDLYDLPPKELKKIPTVCGSLREALQNLDKDRAFLKAGGVFNDDFIDSYIELKMQDVMKFEMTPHPVEFTMYYSY